MGQIPGAHTTSPYKFEKKKKVMRCLYEKKSISTKDI